MSALGAPSRSTTPRKTDSRKTGIQSTSFRDVTGIFAPASVQYLYYWTFFQVQNRGH
jgi:hypothetical protein